MARLLLLAAAAASPPPQFVYVMAGEGAGHHGVGPWLAELADASGRFCATAMCANCAASERRCAASGRVRVFYDRFRVPLFGLEAGGQTG